MRNRRNVLDVLNFETDSIQRTHRRFATRTRTTNFDVDILHAKLRRSTRRLFRRNLCGETVSTFANP